MPYFTGKGLCDRCYIPGRIYGSTALGAFAGISLGKDLKDFAKMGWKLVIITLFVITGTFIFSALVADVILKLTGAI